MSRRVVLTLLDVCRYDCSRRVPQCVRGRDTEIPLSPFISLPRSRGRKQDDMSVTLGDHPLSLPKHKIVFLSHPGLNTKPFSRVYDFMEDSSGFLRLGECLDTP